MRIGIFSGSFDPVHTGHAMIANYASQWSDLDEVWIVVSPLNPLKKGSHPAPDSDRLAMASLVAAKCDGVRVSDFEFSLPIPSYTYNTLVCLRERFPEHEFSLIIGSDNWLQFDKWRDSEKIVRDFSIYIYPRPGYDICKEDMPLGVTVMDAAPRALISSSFVRDSVKEGKNLNYFLPGEVFDYILKHRLYLNER